MQTQMPGGMRTQMPGAMQTQMPGAGMQGMHGMQQGPLGSPMKPGDHPLAQISNNKAAKPEIVERPTFYERVYANSGVIAPRDGAPTFTVSVPSAASPVEIVACLSQVDNRISQKGPDRDAYHPILLKVYELISGDTFSCEMVCKSNWLPVRDSMVAFKCKRGGSYKVVAEFADSREEVNGLIFRCYSSMPNVEVSATSEKKMHRIVEPSGPPRAIKWSFVGCVDPSRVSDPNAPEPYDKGSEWLRRLPGDANACSVM